MPPDEPAPHPDRAEPPARAPARGKSAPLVIGDVHVQSSGWKSLPQLPSVSTNGASYPYDPVNGGWVLGASQLGGDSPALSRVEAFEQDATGSGNGVPGAWQIQDSSSSSQQTGISMSDQPCDTWAGVP